MTPEKESNRTFTAIQRWIDAGFESNILYPVSSAMVVSFVGNSMEQSEAMTRPFRLPPLSFLPSPTKVMCNCAGLLPVKMAPREGG